MRLETKLNIVSALIVLATTTSMRAQSVVYDGRSGAVVDYTTAAPRTFMGQAFDIADPGGPPAIASIHLAVIAATAVNYSNTMLRVQLWDTFNATNSPVFSNPVGSLQDLITGPISASGAAYWTFTLNFTAPIALTGLTGHGLTVNWLSDPTGTGTFALDTNLTAALRGSGSANVNPGTNSNPSSGYYRNASGETDFNFQSTDSRTLKSSVRKIFCE